MVETQGLAGEIQALEYVREDSLLLKVVGTCKSSEIIRITAAECKCCGVYFFFLQRLPLPVEDMGFYPIYLRYQGSGRRVGARTVPPQYSHYAGANVSERIAG